MKMIIFLMFFLINVIIINSSPIRKLTRPSCGHLLVSRVKLICSRYGGYNNLNTDEHRRVRRGIVDECCHRVCDDKDIAEYCVPAAPIIENNNNKFDIFQTIRHIQESQEFQDYNDKLERKIIIHPPNTTRKSVIKHPLRSLPNCQIGTVSPEFMRTAAIYPRLRKD